MALHEVHPVSNQNSAAVNEIRLLHSVGIPIYRQIVTQVRFMIEAGQLVDGDRLPSSRLLADNLRVNRNTVAKAYAELRDAGLVESRRRNGMVVRGSLSARQRSTVRTSADDIMSKAVEACLRLGLSADEISTLALHWAAHIEQTNLRVVFVECNKERATYFAGELSERLLIDVEPLVLGEFKPADQQAELAVTTFFHLAQVRRLMRGVAGEIVAIVAAPHVRTLVKLANLGAKKRIGVLYSTDEQAELIRDSLVNSGLNDIRVLSDTSDAALDAVDVVVVPSEMPQVRNELEGRVETIDFGNVLDESSTRMVAAVIDDLREMRRNSTPEV